MCSLSTKLKSTVILPLVAAPSSSTAALTSSLITAVRSGISILGLHHQRKETGTTERCEMGYATLEHVLMYGEEKMSYPAALRDPCHHKQTGVAAGREWERKNSGALRYSSCSMSTGSWSWAYAGCWLQWRVQRTPHCRLLTSKIHSSSREPIL